MESFESKTHDWLIRPSDDVDALPSAYTIKELCRMARSLDRELMTPLTLSLLGYTVEQIALSMELDEPTVRSRIDDAVAHFGRLRICHDEGRA